MLAQPCQKNLKKCWLSVPDERSNFGHSFTVTFSEHRTFTHLTLPCESFWTVDCENGTCKNCYNSRKCNGMQLDLFERLINEHVFNCETFDVFKYYHKPLQLSFSRCIYFYRLYTFCSDILIVRSPLHMFKVRDLTFICFCNINLLSKLILEFVFCQLIRVDTSSCKHRTLKLSYRVIKSTYTYIATSRCR